MINAQDIKNGTCIRMDGKLYFCIEFLHVKPGKGNTFMRTKLKDVVSGYVLERRFNIGEKLEDVRVERRPYQFLYKEGEDYIFMNQETFDQHPIAHDLINGVDFLLEGAVLDVVSDASTETERPKCVLGYHSPSRSCHHIPNQTNLSSIYNCLYEPRFYYHRIYKHLSVPAHRSCHR